MTAGWTAEVPVLTGVRLRVAPGEVVGLTGPSGGGKSTLARVAALLLAPQAGRVAVDDVPVTGVRYAVPPALRGSVGMVFQSPRRSVDPRLRLADVIAEPLRVPGTATAGRRRAGARDARVAELADRVGLTGDLLRRRPQEVSDGQLQRACLARALAQRPRYLVCDEMTAMLDASTAAALVSLVRAEAHAGRLGVLAVSHDDDLLAAWADRVADVRAWSARPQPQVPVPGDDRRS
ncbi:ATP-binding cassette domain-containing protein [Blastococcus sp. TF02A_35]|uniref:ABC transporter ATP-binding protein n=1 Tax=Blastococcus sp. TF02A-35 TaxID=2559612 RepID=UPI001ADD8682|nr:ATP-binding cassette domain-containing protein [Blastococcus sp. TF02A_35]